MPSSVEEESHIKHQAIAEEFGSTTPSVDASTWKETVALSDRGLVCDGRAHPIRARLAKDPVNVLAIATVGFRFELELEQPLWLDGVAAVSIVLHDPTRRKSLP